MYKIKYYKYKYKYKSLKKNIYYGGSYCENNKTSIQSIITEIIEKHKDIFTESNELDVDIPLDTVDIPIDIPINKKNIIYIHDNKYAIKYYSIEDSNINKKTDKLMTIFNNHKIIPKYYGMYIKIENNEWASYDEWVKLQTGGWSKNKLTRPYQNGACATESTVTVRDDWQSSSSYDCEDPYNTIIINAAYNTNLDAINTGTLRFDNELLSECEKKLNDLFEELKKLYLIYGDMKLSNIVVKYNEHDYKIIDIDPKFICIIKENKKNEGINTCKLKIIHRGGSITELEEVPEEIVIVQEEVPEEVPEIDDEEIDDDEIIEPEIDDILIAATNLYKLVLFIQSYGKLFKTNISNLIYKTNSTKIIVTYNKKQYDLKLNYGIYLLIYDIYIKLLKYESNLYFNMYRYLLIELKNYFLRNKDKFIKYVNISKFLNKGINQDLQSVHYMEGICTKDTINLYIYILIIIIETYLSDENKHLIDILGKERVDKIDTEILYNFPEV